MIPAKQLVSEKNKYEISKTHYECDNKRATYIRCKL